MAFTYKAVMTEGFSVESPSAVVRYSDDWLTMEVSRHFNPTWIQDADYVGQFIFQTDMDLEGDAHDNEEITEAEAEKIVKTWTDGKSNSDS